MTISSRLRRGSPPYAFVVGLAVLAGCRHPEGADDSGPPGEESGGTSDSADSSHDDSDSAGDDTGGAPPVDAGFAGLDQLGVRNVVFVHVDTLRADHLPMYGYARDTTPQMGTRSWFVVEDHYATASWTLPSTASVLTGLGVEHHGVTHVESSGLAQPLVSPTLANALVLRGVATLLYSGNHALDDAGDGFEDGFTTVNPPVGDEQAKKMVGITEASLQWLDTMVAEDAPFFMFLQPMDVHQPYSPRDEFLGTWSDPDALPFDLDASGDEQITALNAAYAAATTDDERAAVRTQLDDIYDEDVLGVDLGIGQLLDGLAARGHAEDTLVVVAADHGESLFDDPVNLDLGHGSSVRQELVRVPLLFYNPRLPAQVQPCLSQNVDTSQTILEALGKPLMADVDGQPLQAGCRTLATFSTFEGETDNTAISEVGVTDGDYTLRWSCHRSEVSWYDLTADPGGLTPIAREDVPSGDTLQGALTTFVAALDDGVGSAGCAVPQ